MPVVPSPQLPNVQQAPLPNVQTGGTPSVEAFGGGQAIRPDLSGVKDAAQSIYDQAYQKANQVALVGASAQLSKASTDLQVYTQQQRGQNALAVPDKVATDWQTTTSAIRNTLANDDQRRAFDARAQSEWNQLYETTQEHVAAESTQYDHENTQALIDAKTNAALQNYQKPGIVDQSVAEQAAVLQDWGTRQGLPQALIDQQVADTTSKTYADVVRRMVDDKNDLGATAYYNTIQDKLTGQDQLALAGPLAMGSVLGAAQRQGDAIMATATDLTDGLKQAAQIADPRVREETEQRIRQSFSDRAADIRQQQQQVFTQAEQILEKTGDINNIPVSMRSQLTAEDNIQLHRRFQELQQAKNPQVQTNYQVYNQLQSAATFTPGSRATFANYDLTKFQQYLSPTDFKHMESLQTTVRTQLRNDAARSARAAQKTNGAAALQALVGGGAVSTPTPGAPLPKPSGAGGDVNLTAPSSSPNSQGLSPQQIDLAHKDPSYAEHLRQHGITVP